MDAVQTMIKYQALTHYTEQARIATLEFEYDELVRVCNGLLARLTSHQNVHCKTVLAEDVEAIRAALARIKS